MPVSSRRRLILHVGQPKAGSTAIQNYLEAQRSALLAHGILFPKSYFLRRNPFDAERSPGHKGLIDVLSKGDLSELDQELAATSATRVIISIENLFADQPEQTFQHIADAFSGWDICLLAVLRHPNRWIVSRYIEEILSNSKWGTLTLPEFVDRNIDWLLYADRLEMFARVLKPRSVKLINYDTALRGRGLLQEFLECTQLPNTDPALVSRLRSNVREKSEFLIEGKRRLNAILPKLPLLIRQEIEAEVRETARSLLNETELSLNEFPAAVAFPDELSVAVAASNRRLVTRFGLCPAFDNTSLTAIPPWFHRESMSGIDTLVDHGFRAAACILRKRGADPMSGFAGELLKSEGSEYLFGLLNTAKVSLHIESPATALWAAGHVRKLVFLVAEATPYSDCDRLNTLHLPSDVVPLSSDAVAPATFERHPPEIVISHYRVPAERIIDTWQRCGSVANLALIGFTESSAQTISEKLGLVLREMIGTVRLLAPSRFAKVEKKS